MLFIKQAFSPDNARETFGGLVYKRTAALDELQLSASRPAKSLVVLPAA